MMLPTSNGAACSKRSSASQTMLYSNDPDICCEACSVRSSERDDMALSIAMARCGATQPERGDALTSYQVEMKDCE